MNIKEKIKTYTKLLDELDILAKSIFNYFKEFPTICKFYGYCKFDFFEIKDDEFIIVYRENEYDYDDIDTFSIPLTHIYNNTWKQYIVDMVEEEREKSYRMQLKLKQDEKEYRYNLYQELKTEFEK